MLIFAAAGMLASCSNDEVVEVPTATTAIGFDQAHVNNSTRGGTATTATSLQTGFKVWGDMVNPTDGTNDVANIFNNVTVSFVTENSAWTYEPLRYWTPGNNYAFTAIGPVSASFTFTESTLAADDLLNYYHGSINWINNGSQDLVYAFATVTNASANNTAVSFTFNHLLSQVRLQFDNLFPSEGAQIQISGVSITSASTGTLDLSSVASSTSNQNLEWTPTSETNTISYNFANTSATDLKTSSLMFANNTQGSYGVSTVGTAQTDAFFLIPNQETITINFTVELFSVGTDGTSVSAGKWAHTVPVILTNTTSHDSNHEGSNSATKLKPGYSYTLIADLTNENVNPQEQLTPISFAIQQVSSFASYTGSEYEVPSDDNN